jgi:hypothetical protein
MTEPTRSARPRRSGRRPGWVLLTVLLVLAIGSSSALVFTDRVELLKLAVILALWAAVVAAFVSVIYRRQSDLDQAKVRDLKLVYDLQLDREISARREYELSVESQLRRELVSEIRAQAADEVAGLRAELAALRANLEILFDADLSHRPAIEHDRTSARSFDWSPTPEAAGRVTASRLDTEDRDDTDFRTDESPIIDVHEEPHPPDHEWTPPASEGGAHRRGAEAARENRRYAPTPPVPPPTENERTTQFTWPAGQEPPKPPEPVQAPPPPPPQPPPQPVQAPPPPAPEPVPQPEPTPAADWRPAPAEGRWIPAGTPGSNWVAPPPPPPPQPEQPPAHAGSADEYVGRRRAPAPGAPHSQPAMSTPPPELPRRGRHSAPPEAADPGRAPAPPTLAAESAEPPPHTEPEPPEPPFESRRHRVSDEETTGGQSVADLLARLQAAPSGGGRRRRRDE